MADNSTATSERSESTPVTDSPATEGRSAPIILCSIALIGSFFLPFIKVLGGVIMINGITIFTAQEFGERGKLFAIIPSMAVLTIIICLVLPKLQRAFSVATGVLPLIVFVYYFNQAGSELFQVLGVGAYLCMAMGAALFMLSCKGNQ